MALIDTSDRPGDTLGHPRDADVPGSSTGLTGVDLYEIPDALIPREPRLGGLCVPVPADRIAALERSGPVVLGLHAGFAHTDGFVASVMSELRALLRLPAEHSCVLVPAPPQTLARLLAGEKWAVANDAVPLPVLETEGPPAPSDPETWTSADLSRTSWPLHGTVLGDLDVACFCPSWLLGVVAGCTVLTLSARAAAAARAEQDSGPFGVRALLEPREPDGPGVSASDLMMLAHGVRSLAEAEPERFEDEVEARLDLVRTLSAGRPWLAGPPYRPGRDLAAVLPTTLAPGTVQEVSDFLESHALVYGLADPERPGALRIGLYRTVADDDLVRLLGLLDILLGESR
ncbi:hypothetical protein [Streptomyces sp. NPDC058394]|uniref:hypothetical protein n=1 Tax=unclassified Streptomyces TaxID=2593676 RepID=UPI003664146E